MKYRNGKRYGQLRSILKHRRKELGLTQRQLSARLKRDKNFVQRFESGELSIDVIEHLQYCRALRIDPVEVTRQLVS